MDADCKIHGAKGAKMSRGFSLIEVMFAMAVLVVGLLGGITVIAVATANDGRSKLHSTAILLAQSTMEKIAAIPAASANTQTSLTDCAGNPHTIETAVPPPGGSPAMINGGAFSGTIDFSQPTVANYSMVYVTCSSGGNVGYDVRWRIDSGPPPTTQPVPESAKPRVRAGAPQLCLPYPLHPLRRNV
jgi:prepilin-type N-terminal cleavage/methylation domain-containing protein